MVGVCSPTTMVGMYPYYHGGYTPYYTLPGTPPGHTGLSTGTPHGRTVTGLPR